MLLNEIKMYSFIGVFNTILHMVVFWISISCGLSSALSNIIAFLVAATFSFFANAKLTFKCITSKKKYILFLFVMGCLAILTGWLIDVFRLPKMLAVIFLSFISWVVSFISSKKIIFK